jgi:hypothetical protein
VKYYVRPISEVLKILFSFYMREEVGEGPRDGNSGCGDVLENPTCKSKVSFSCGEDLIMVILYPFIVVQLLNRY